MLKRIFRKAEDLFFVLYLPLAGMAIVFMAIAALGKETSERNSLDDDP